MYGAVQRASETQTACVNCLSSQAEKSEQFSVAGVCFVKKVVP